MLRPRIPLPRLGALRPVVQRRCLHKVPPLRDDFVERGVGKDFLSPAAVDLSWTQYQTLALEKLNRLLAGREDDSSVRKNGLQNLVIESARDPSKAPIFNYASMAHNNQFFYESLSHDPVAIPERLEEHLVETFGSLETLRREFLTTAIAMFGPGFVWLVRARQADSAVEHFRLLPTYLAGTPYPEAHYRRQSVDNNTVEAGGGGVNDWMAKQRAAVGAAPRLDGSINPKMERAAGGLDRVTPVLCLNTWEHVWMPDYGIITLEGREAKRVYVERWWNHIDWNVVARRAKLAPTSTMQL